MHISRGFNEYPKDDDLTGVVSAAVHGVSEKLARLDGDELAVSGDTHRILCETRPPSTGAAIRPGSHSCLNMPRARWTLRTEIERTARTFAWALPENERPFSDLTLVTFNDRFGLLSLIARECNIGTIIHAHTNDKRCDDARVIGRITGNKADRYICGDIEDVHFFMKRIGMSCDVFVSREGIGGAPDPRLFFDTLFDMSESGFSFGFDSFGPVTSSARVGGATDEAASLRRHLLDAGFRVDRFHTSTAEKGPFVPRLKGSISDLALRLVRRRPSEQPPVTADRFAIFGVRPPGAAVEWAAPRRRRSPLRAGAATLQPTY